MRKSQFSNCKNNTLPDYQTHLEIENSERQIKNAWENNSPADAITAFQTLSNINLVSLNTFVTMISGAGDHKCIGIANWVYRNAIEKYKEDAEKRTTVRTAMIEAAIKSNCKDQARQIYEESNEDGTTTPRINALIANMMQEETTEPYQSLNNTAVFFAQRTQYSENIAKRNATCKMPIYGE